jgi:hypothetical protein
MAQPFSVSSMFITPSQRIGFMQQQQQLQYGRDLQAAQAAASASPMQQALQSAVTGFGGQVGGALSQYGISSALMSQLPWGYRPPSSYNPQNDPEIYSFPRTNTSEIGPQSTSLFPEYSSSNFGL